MREGIPTRLQELFGIMNKNIKYTKEKLEGAVKNSKSISDAMSNW